MTALKEARQQHERRIEQEREEQTQREELERWEANCRALGGKPVTLYTHEGSERACRAPSGGILPVPE
jgi:hypothetical protein